MLYNDVDAIRQVDANYNARWAILDEECGISCPSKAAFQRSELLELLDQSSFLVGRNSRWVSHTLVKGNATPKAKTRKPSLMPLNLLMAPFPSFQRPHKQPCTP
jgi:hypothetical protein